LNMDNLTAKEITDLNLSSQAARNAELGTVVNNLITGLNNVIVEATPVNAVNAKATLTFTSVVTDGETINIWNNVPLDPGEEALPSDTYEFCADAAQTVSQEGNIPVDIEANTTKASVVLTVDTKPTAGDTMTIGTKKYTFVAVAAGDVDGEIEVGADKAEAQANIVAAINGTDGFSVPHPEVSAAEFAADACTITALVGGTVGNGVESTETFTANTNVFATATLAGGADCSAANAITALVAAITASDTQGVGAADGAGDTVVLTADVAGVGGNLIEIQETLINGTVPGLLSGGVDGTVGAENAIARDASYLYVAVAANTISGKNWRRISLGAAY
jgi:hypothetical protein